MLSLFPVLVAYTGYLGAVGSAVFWALTGRLEPILLGFAGTMMTFGEAGKLASKLRRSIYDGGGQNDSDELDE